jgi:hypothetical protein
MWGGHTFTKGNNKLQTTQGLYSIIAKKQEKIFILNGRNVTKTRIFLIFLGGTT